MARAVIDSWRDDVAVYESASGADVLRALHAAAPPFLITVAIKRTSSSHGYVGHAFVLQHNGERPGHYRVTQADLDASRMAVGRLAWPVAAVRAFFRHLRAARYWDAALAARVTDLTGCRAFADDGRKDEVSIEYEFTAPLDGTAVTACALKSRFMTALLAAEGEH